MRQNKLLITLALCLISTFGFSQLVTNPTELNNAINASGPGTIITLGDGNWNNVFINIKKDGTSEAPITISAQNPGAALMTGNSRVYMEGSYLIVSGLVFQDPSNLVASSSEIEPVIELKSCDYCKVLNNKIDAYNGTEAQKEIKFKWVLADGEYNEIAYNSFIGKYGIGSIINDNRNLIGPDYLKIHHNYFADRTPINELNEDNNQDAIRIGNSGTSLGDSYSEVYDNYFYNFFGELEVISNKAGENKYYTNTFRNYSGTLTLRHGNNCEVFGNYFFADDNFLTGGVRVIGEGHKIYNNYIEAVNSTKPGGALSNGTGGINVSNGRLNSELSGYYQVKNTQIINNTFVNCDYALRIGTKVKSDLDQEPENLSVANNIMYNTSVNSYQIITSPSGTSVSEGNITELSGTSLVDDGIFHRIAGGSAPVDAGIGSYPFLTHDILGGDRDTDFDAGAEELEANGSKLPYDALDVGVSIGFGALSNPTLTANPATITFTKYADTMTFEVIANIDWSITEDIPWLNLDITSGSGSRTITAIATENNTGAERTATLSINENGGGNGLSSELAIVQLETFIPTEIQIVGTTTVGMQDKEGISEENAYNDDNTNYWTGDPDTEPEVSITFDLACSHVLTEIGINFWKADERTTTFSIAVANEASGPFNTVIDSATSSDSNVTVDSEQLFNLNETIGRYVKFIGIGNSSSTNWTSIANVNIYGDENCENVSTGIFNNQKEEERISIFPVPANEGIITIKSEVKVLKRIEIYNAKGQLVLTTNGNHLLTKQIDISLLNAGTYFIKMEEIGGSTFIIN